MRRLRKKVPDGASGDVLGRPAEHPDGGGAERPDHAPGVKLEHGVGHSVEQRPQPFDRLTLLAAAPPHGVAGKTAENAKQGEGDRADQIGRIGGQGAVRQNLVPDQPQNNDEQGRPNPAQHRADQQRRHDHQEGTSLHEHRFDGALRGQTGDRRNKGDQIGRAVA